MRPSLGAIAILLTSSSPQTAAAPAPASFPNIGNYPCWITLKQTLDGNQNSVFGIWGVRTNNKDTERGYIEASTLPLLVQKAGPPAVRVQAYKTDRKGETLSYDYSTQTWLSTDSQCSAQAWQKTDKNKRLRTLTCGFQCAK